MSYKKFTDYTDKSMIDNFIHGLWINIQHPNDIGDKNSLEMNCFKETRHLKSLSDFHQYKLNFYLDTCNHTDDNVDISNDKCSQECLQGALWHVNQWYEIESAIKYKTFFWFLFVIPLVRLVTQKYVNYLDKLQLKGSGFFTRTLRQCRYLLCPEKRLQDIKNQKMAIFGKINKHNQRLLRST